MNDYLQHRTAFLEKARLELERDGRFLAAWLEGSFGRGEADGYSDVDLWVAVEDDVAGSICERNGAARAGTVAARREILDRFGDPAIVHEHHGNAPPGGSFTSSIYRESGLPVDWTFVPLSIARRASASLLLFDLVGIPLRSDGPLPASDERIERLGERYAFFWLLSVPAAKAVRRHNGVRFHSILELMHGALREVESLLDGEAMVYSRYSIAPFCPDAESQWQALVELCNRADSMIETLRSAGVKAPERPLDVLPHWLPSELGQ
ncbi:MAG: nucleotidyltransferase domain-containing protein [Thermomicrobiales bacterium]